MDFQNLARSLARQVLKLSLTSLLVCPLAQADETSAHSFPAPIAWGILSEAKGCVIFREYTKTKVGFWVVAVTSKTHSELEVIESSGYTLEQSKLIEDQQTMDDLQRRSLKDEIRYVKISDKYSPDELAAARDLCKRRDVRD